jgi:hypothetical protein
MATYAKIDASKKLLSQQSLALPDGNTLVTEVIQAGPDAFITGNILVGPAGIVINSTWCGTCAGKSVGCVDCPRNDPVLDCPNSRIYCQS